MSPDFVLTAAELRLRLLRPGESGPLPVRSEKFGSPAYSEAELAGAPEPARAAADKVLAAALPVSLRPGGAQPPPGAAPPRLIGSTDHLVSAKEAA